MTRSSRGIGFDPQCGMRDGMMDGLVWISGDARESAPRG